MATPEEMLESMKANLPEKTGKTLKEWFTLLKTTDFEKHGQFVNFLKKEHSVTHGFANLIANQFRNDGVAAEDPVETQYSGAKAALKPLYDQLTVEIRKFGPDVDVSPRKTYVSLRRKKQFALIQPSTRTRVDVGLCLKGKKPTKRLEESGSFNSMVTHRVRLESLEDVNTQLINWLKEAYDHAG